MPIPSSLLWIIQERGCGWALKASAPYYRHLTAPTELRNRHLVELRDKQPVNPNAFNRLYPIKATAAKVLKRHPVLHHLTPGELDWADLQFIESEILISAILQFAKECDMSALPIHDSIIVPKRGELIGRRCLSEAFTRTAKMTPVIEIKE